MADPIKDNLELGKLGEITTYQAGALQAAANRALRLHCDKLLSPYGITKTQWLVIGLILDAGTSGLRFGEICRKLDIQAANLTRIITALKKKRMITSKDDDKGTSQQLLSIHPAFPSECPEIEHILRTGLRQSIYASITPLEFRIYLKVLYHLSQLRST